MKKLLKFLGVTLAGLVLLILGAVALVYLKPLPTYADVPLPDLQIRATPAMLEHGQKLVMMNCTGCHYNEAGDRLSGRLFPDADTRALGMIYSANITQHPQHGIGAYTDAELYRLLRTGVKRDHHLALPMMAGSPTASEEDLLAVIAFLRSDHPLVQPDPTQHPDFRPNLLTRALFHLMFKPTPLPAAPVVAPDPADEIAWGQHLLEARYGCYHCHSTQAAELDPLHPSQGPGYLAGGMVFHVENWHGEGESFSVTAPSLLSREGVLSWSEDQFVAAVLWGMRPSQVPYQPPMHPYTMMDSSEARAIYQYLHSYQRPAVGQR